MRYLFILLSVMFLAGYVPAQTIGNFAGQELFTEFETYRPKALPTLPARNAPVLKSNLEGVVLTPAKIDDLAALGKVWGFLKYHHPAVALGASNWDMELFRVLPDIMAAQSKLERNEILSQWLRSLGDFETAGPLNPVDVKLEADTAWIDPRDFGIKLAKQLNLVKNARRTGTNRYIRLAPGVGNPVFQNEEPYATPAYPDTEHRLLALFRYWNVIHYYFPNRHLNGVNWNSMMSEFVPRFFNAPNELEYKKSLLVLICRINDTHAGILGPDDTVTAFRGVNASAVRMTFIDGKAVVARYWDQTLGERSGLLPGDVIESIGGRPVADIVQERWDYQPASNTASKYRDIATNLLRTNDSFINVVYRRDGISRAVQLQTYPYASMATFDNYYHNPPQAYRVIGKDIGYLCPGPLQDNEILEIIPQIASTRGFVIDMRCYPGGNFGGDLANFLEARTMIGKASMGSIRTPGLFTFTAGIFYGSDSTPHYTGQVVILVNEVTQSSMEFHTMIFRGRPGTIVVGSTTSGADGNVSDFTLPGNVRTRISGIGIYLPDGTETQRVGIIPDVFVGPTIQGLKDGRDEQLEKAIEVINSNK